MDRINRGDKLRELKPARIAIEGEYTVYYFSFLMFENPRYSIPGNSELLFRAYIEGGSRSYSSDGQIPALLAAIEAQAIIQKVRQIALNKYHPLNKKAQTAIMKGKVQREDWEVVRGTVGLVLGKWMPTDWQKKRYTDDIDFFWPDMDSDLFAYVLTRLGWKTDDKTPGCFSKWTKEIPEVPGLPLECCNDWLIGREFGGVDAAVEGVGLKGILSWKFRRCHDVDISDIINVALKGYLNIDQDDIVHPWRAVMEALWRGGKDDIGHLITVSQHAFAIANHLRSVGLALEEHVADFLDKNHINTAQIEEIYNKQTPISHKLLGSINWEPFKRGSASTIKQMRKELYSFFLNQSEKRLNYASRLKTFAHALVWSLNAKFKVDRLKLILTKNP